MKKTLIASAVAAATLASGAAMADGHLPTVYGSIDLVQTYTDNGANEKSSFGDNGSTIGFKHSHEITPGLKAMAQAEFEFAADGSGGGIDTFDNHFVGLEGDFGSAWIGDTDGAYENIDVIDHSEAVGIAGSIAGIQTSDSLNYVSPSMGGVTAQATLIMDDNTDVVAPQAHVGALSVNYTMDNISVTGAYAIAEGDGEDAFGIGATVGMGDYSVAAQFESMDETTLIGLLGVATMGSNQFALGFSMLDEDGDETMSIYGQALHNVSDNMYVYVEVLNADQDSAADPVLDLALGVSYGF